tara:strand:- start:18 stop:1088 length:1071 start_codon:yes stop_codon:yes gene_type:complete
MNGHILINRKNIAHNFSEIKKYSSNSKIMSVIKSDAYGHGMIEVAKSLSTSDSFAVATIKEAMYLRSKNITKEIVCLQGFSNSEELIYCSKNNIRPVIHDSSQINIMDTTSLSDSIKLWIKIDTGMNRLGFNNLDFQKIYKKINENKKVQNPIGIMTHLACADEDDDKFSDKQMSLFKKIVNKANIELSIFNSAGIIKYSKNNKDINCWLRPGLMLYGVGPCSLLKGINLKPAMTLTAPIISIKKCRKGDSIGYGQTHILKKDTRIAAVGIGYGDGLPRKLSNIGKVFYNNNIFNIVGRVSMDIITVDIGDKDIKVGCNVELWGENINIKEVANSIDSIPYELMCALGNRLEKEYI